MLQNLLYVPQLLLILCLMYHFVNKRKVQVHYLGSIFHFVKLLSLDEQQSEIERLHSESERSRFEPHRCAWPGFGTHPRYEVPSDLPVKVEIAL